MQGKRVAIAAVAAGAAALLLAQNRPKEEPFWGLKSQEAAKYLPPHKPHTKLSDLKAKHAGEKNWRQVIVDDDHLNGVYIQAAPGVREPRRFHPDTREWWVVMDGQIRFDIEGQESFVARKGSMVQVPMQTMCSMETIGDKPSLRFEVNIAKAKTFYPKDVEPPKISGFTWIPAVMGRKPGPYDHGNVPHINLYELAERSEYKDRNFQHRFVHDDRAVANIIYGWNSKLPPLNPKDRGHYHPECAEFWLIMTGQIRYPIEKVGVVIAEEGDVVYVPPSTFHAPRWWGEGPSCRLAMNGYTNIAHVRDAVVPH